MLCSRLGTRSNKDGSLLMALPSKSSRDISVAAESIA